MTMSSSMTAENKTLYACGYAEQKHVRTQSMQQIENKKTRKGDRTLACNKNLANFALSYRQLLLDTSKWYRTEIDAIEQK